MLGILQLCLCFEPRGFECVRGQIVERTVWPFRVVLLAERGQAHPCLGQRGEDVQVQALVADRSVEAFLLPILLARQLHQVRRIEHNSSKSPIPFTPGVDSASRS